MRTLEQKDIAANLPYGLKVYSDQKVYTIVEWRLGKPNDMLAKHDNGSSLIFNFNRKETKPLLRPITDLTKEITHRGEKFVPWDRIRAISRFFELDDCGLLFMQNGCTQSEWLCVLDKLAEWMFDYRGLIPDGLAVDVNTLVSNPYEV